MESWHLGRFRSPYLSIEAVSIDPVTDSVEILAGEASYTIRPEDSGSDLDGLAAALSSLRDPRSPLWTDVLRKPLLNPGLRGLIEQIDELSLVEEADVQDDSSTLRYLLECVDQVFEKVKSQVPASCEQALTEAVATVAQRADDLVHELTLSYSQPVRVSVSRHFSNPREETSLFVMFALEQLEYYRLYAPQSLVFSSLLLRRFTNHVADASLSSAELVHVAMDLMPTVSLKDTAVRLNCLGCLLLQASCGVRAIRPGVTITRNSPCSGTTLATHAERVALTTLDDLGSFAFLRALSSPPVPATLIQGCFIEEYHVTCRFVEIITAVLARRLKASIRQQLFRYYAEELGHERFERATCESLGIGVDQLERAIPLPLHVAFVDIFTSVAASDPISYFASIFVTEGLFGRPSPLNDLIEKGFKANAIFSQTFRRHEDLNDELSHSSLSRLLLSEISTITPRQYERALETVVMLVQLNYFAWNALHDHYSGASPIPYTGFIPQLPIHLKKAG